MAELNNKIAESKIYRDESWPPQDNIEMCHAQGKPAINADDPECKVIRTVWPNGVVDDHWLFTHEVVCTWPDGKRERFRHYTPEHISPVLPGDEEPT